MSHVLPYTKSYEGSVRVSISKIITFTFQRFGADYESINSFLYLSFYYYVVRVKHFYLCV